MLRGIFQRARRRQKSKTVARRVTNTHLISRRNTASVLSNFAVGVWRHRIALRARGRLFKEPIGKMRNRYSC